MMAIVNGKLYDTEKANRIMVVFVPDGDSHIKTFDVYQSQKGNIFAVYRNEDMMISISQIKEMINGRPDLIDAYIQFFGMPEEA